MFSFLQFCPVSKCGTRQNCSVSNILRTTENCLVLSPIQSTPPTSPCRWCKLDIITWYSYLLPYVRCILTYTVMHITGHRCIDNVSLTMDSHILAVYRSPWFDSSVIIAVWWELTRQVDEYNRCVHWCGTCPNDHKYHAKRQLCDRDVTNSPSSPSPVMDCHNETYSPPLGAWRNFWMTPI